MARHARALPGTDHGFGRSRPGRSAGWRGRHPGVAWRGRSRRHGCHGSPVGIERARDAVALAARSDCRSSSGVRDRLWRAWQDRARSDAAGAIRSRRGLRERLRRRGGSSSMPHKQNPVRAVTAVAAAIRAPGLVATMVAAMPQEHERAAGGWQAEWETLADLIRVTSESAGAIADTLGDVAARSCEPCANTWVCTAVWRWPRASRQLLMEHLSRTDAMAHVERLSRVAVRDRRPLREARIRRSRSVALVVAGSHRPRTRSREFSGFGAAVRRAGAETVGAVAMFVSTDDGCRLHVIPGSTAGQCRWCCRIHSAPITRCGIFKWPPSAAERAVWRYDTRGHGESRQAARRLFHRSSWPGSRVDHRRDRRRAVSISAASRSVE